MSQDRSVVQCVLILHCNVLGCTASNMGKRITKHQVKVLPVSQSFIVGNRRRFFSLTFALVLVNHKGLVGVAMLRFARRFRRVVGRYGVGCHTRAFCCYRVNWMCPGYLHSCNFTLLVWKGVEIFKFILSSLQYRECATLQDTYTFCFVHI